MISPECFSALPTADSSGVLHKSYRRMLQQSIMGALESAADGLQTNIAPIVSRYRLLDVTRQMSPAPYAATSQLSDAINEGRVTSDVEAINLLQQLTDDEIFDSTFRVGTILAEHWETGFVNTMRATHPGR